MTMLTNIAIQHIPRNYDKRIIAADVIVLVRWSKNERGGVITMNDFYGLLFVLVKKYWEFIKERSFKKVR